MTNDTQPTEVLSDAARFFFEHAGYAYYPNKETPEQGRTRGALALADAEAWAKAAGYRFEWYRDPDIDSSDFSDESPAWQLWECAMLAMDGEVVQSLGGIDLGRDGKPSSDPYGRVVEAELASQERPDDDKVTCGHCGRSWSDRATPCPAECARPDARR